MFSVHLDHSFTAEQIVGQAQDELAKLQNQLVDPKELERVKTQVRASAIKEMQSSQNRAQALAQFQLVDGDPELINTELDRVLAVTPAQIPIQRSMLVPEKRSYSHPQPARAAA